MAHGEICCSTASFAAVYEHHYVGEGETQGGGAAGTTSAINVSWLTSLNDYFSRTIGLITTDFDTPGLPSHRCAGRLD